jgi:hypothetical protein
MVENRTPDRPEDAPYTTPETRGPEAAQDENDKKPSPDPNDASRSDDDVQDDDWHRDAQVINAFYGTVQATGASFGIASGTSTRRATGLVDAEQIEAVLRCYLAPAPLRHATEVLGKKHLVMLAGKEGTGKRAGALALLKDVIATKAKIISLSPALSLGELTSDIRFRAGNGYLIQDWIEDSGTETVQRFEVERLLRKLAKVGENGAYLVITTTVPMRRRHFEGLLVEWMAPDPVALFDTCLAKASAPLPLQSEIDKVRARVRELHSPAEVVTLTKRLSEGKSAEAALGAVEEFRNAEVAVWFDEKPKRNATLEVAALAFVHAVPERTFESLLSQLTTIADEIRWGESPQARPSSYEDDLPQRRVGWSRQHALIVGSNNNSAQANPFDGERRLVFRCEGHREQVIAELVRRYGYELWEPIRIWARGLATSTAEVRVQVAFGVALLARESLQEVEESFLGPWSRGLALERLTAAHVLSWMCMNDATAPIALRIALRWVQNAGPRPAMTAAVALGGELGVRYPTDCLNWLWFLTLRAEQISEVARRSLTLLFRMAVDRSDHAITALRLLLKLVSDEVRNRAGSPRTRTSLTTIVKILNAESLESPDPLAASLLLSHPESAELLGSLWAWPLCSGPHRASATNALRRTLGALEGHDEALEAAARLGAGVWSSLPSEWLHLVERDLRYSLIDRGDWSDVAPPRELATVLLDVLVRKGTAAGSNDRRSTSYDNAAVPDH